MIFTRIATQTRDARDVGRQHRLVGLSVPRDSHEASPFNSTNIDHLLRNLGIDTLLVCGVVTNGCVEGTCAAVTPALHQAAITNLKDAFCNCRSTQDVVAELASRRPE